MSASPSFGNWQPPPDVVAIGQQSPVPYVGGSEVQAGEASQKSVPDAVKAFRNMISPLHPTVTSGGMRRSPTKPNTPGRRRDLHEEGRAVDFMTTDIPDGTSLANWLVRHSAELGVQLVIWDGTQWYTSTNPRIARWQRYTGNNGHRDHVHVELSPSTAGWTKEQMEATIRGILAQEARTAVEPNPILESIDTGSGADEGLKVANVGDGDNTVLWAAGGAILVGGIGAYLIWSAVNRSAPPQIEVRANGKKRRRK